MKEVPHMPIEINSVGDLGGVMAAQFVGTF